MRSGQQQDRKKLVAMILLTVTMLLGVVAYVLGAGESDGLRRGSVAVILIPLLVGVGMVVFIRRRARDLRAGLPLEDERSKRVMEIVAAKTFYFSLYWLLAISWFEKAFARILFGAESLDAGQVVGGAIAGMTVVFMGLWAYYSKKGE